MPAEMPAGGGGFNLAIANIRIANEYKERPLRLNNASKEELLEAGYSADAARWIIATRSVTVRGCTIGQLSDKLMADDTKPASEAVAREIWEKLETRQFAF